MKHDMFLRNRWIAPVLLGSWLNACDIPFQDIIHDDAETGGHAETGDDVGAIPREDPWSIPCLGDRFPQVYGQQPSTFACPDGMTLAQPFVEAGYCAACSCSTQCTTDADCPDPVTGNAVATCNNGLCRLFCDDATQCPDGMECIDSQGSDRNLCMFAEHAELECSEIGRVAAEPLCDQLTTPESCNAEISDHSAIRCLWVEERLFGTAVDSGACEAATVENRCLAVHEVHETELTNTCGLSSCQADVTYWEEISGGTFGVLDLPCELRPLGVEPDTLTNSTFTGAQCGLPGVRDPLLCECGDGLVCP